MSTTLDETTSPTSPAAGRLRASTAAVRVSFNWFGTHKSLSSEQTARAAESFGAEGNYLSAGKKLLDVRHPAFRAVAAVRGRIVSYWKGMSLPYPEPGLRLIRQDAIEPFDARMNELREELDEAVQNLDRHYGELRAAAAERLGSLFNPADYPAQLSGLFGVAWDYPSVEPPDYLRQLNPAIYAQECQRATARFDEAIQLAEQAFLDELSRLVSHLTERLSGADDGQPKVFRDSAVGNLTEFFERFRQLNVRSNEQLDHLVGQAQRIVRNVAPQQLRDSAPLRQRVASELAGVQSVLDGLLVDRPRRNILRRPRTESTA